MSDFDDYYLCPTQISQLRSRSEVDMHSNFMGLYPIISSPMKGVSGSKLVIEMGQNNCLGILHRFMPIEDRFKNIEIIAGAKVPYGVAIGVNDWEIELDIAEYAAEHGAVLITLDLANGYIPQIEEMGNRLRNRLGSKIKLMTGNVIDEIGADYLRNSYFDIARASIGSGNVCTTRQMTRVGRNALAVLKECSHIDIELCIDGGIRTPGDVAISFACGADYAMLGSVLAQSFEAESTEGKLYGMASFTNHVLNNKEIKSIEGRDEQVDVTKKKPLKEILDQFLWGIRSACTYLNCKSYQELSSKARLVPINEKI